MQEQIVIGLAGEMGCGKGTVAQYLAHAHGAVSFRFSDPIRDILDRIYREKSRENLTEASRMLRQTYGQDIFSSIVYHDVMQANHKIVLVDGIRRESDMAYLQKLPFFRLVYIETGIQKRYERITKRSENVGDAKKSFEEFRKEQSLETELSILSLKALAQYVLENNAEVEDLYGASQKMIESFRSELTRSLEIQS